MATQNFDRGRCLRYKSDVQVKRKMKDKMQENFFPLSYFIEGNYSFSSTNKTSCYRTSSTWFIVFILDNGFIDSSFNLSYLSTSTRRTRTKSTTRSTGIWWRTTWFIDKIRISTISCSIITNNNRRKSKYSTFKS